MLYRDTGIVLPAIEGSQWLSCIVHGHPASLSLNMVSTVQIPGFKHHWLQYWISTGPPPVNNNCSLRFCITCYRRLTVIIMYRTRGSQPVLLECSLPAIDGSQWLSCIVQGHPASLSLNMLSTVQIPGLCYSPAIEGSQWLSCIVHGQPASLSLNMLSTVQIQP